MKFWSFAIQAESPEARGRSRASRKVLAVSPACLWLSSPSLAWLITPTLHQTWGEEEVHAQGSLETLRQLVVEDGFFQSHLPTVGEHSFGKALGQTLPSTKGGSCGDRDSEPDA